MATPTQNLHSESKSQSMLVGVFDDRSQALLALDDLQQAGFTKEQVGFALRGSDVVAGGAVTDTLGSKDAKGAAAGAVTGGIIGSLFGAAAAIVVPGVGPVLAAGILANAVGFAGAGAAVGAIMGAMAGDELSEEEARFYEKHFNDGRALVIVRAPDREQTAADIIHRHGGYDVHGTPARQLSQSESLKSGLK